MIQKFQVINGGWYIQNILDVNGIAIVYKDDVTALAVRGEENEWDITPLQETIN